MMWYPFTVTLGILALVIILIFLSRTFLAWGIGRLTRIYIDSKVDIKQAFHEGRNEDKTEE